MVESNESTTQVRWLVVGPVTSSSSQEEKISSFNRSDFLEWFERQRFSCEITLPPNIGEKKEEKFLLQIDKLRCLTLKYVTSTVPSLAKLLTLANNLGEEDEILSSVKELVGEGELYRKIEDFILPRTGSEPPKNEPKSQDNSNSDGDIFDIAQVPTHTSKAASAVDSFLRTASGKSKKVRKVKKSRKIRDFIEDEVYKAAHSILASKEIKHLEMWLRGLKFFADNCSKNAGMQIELIDTSEETILSAIKKYKSADFIEEPNAIFIPTPVKDITLLRNLAELGDTFLCPVIVDIHPQLFGMKDTESMVDALEQIEPKNSDSQWLALRQEEESRWLCGVVNGVVLHSEGSGIAKRELIGSGVWALAALLAQSYTKVGSFARITGKPGSISSPGVRTLSSGRYEGTATPTEIFIPIRGQALLAKHGLLAIGSSRNSETLVLSSTPVLRASSDAVPLPAQLLTGRIVRFSKWVRDQLPPEANSDTAREIFKQAASIFLFPGMTNVGQVEAMIHEENDQRELRIHAQIHPAHAGIPFEIAFVLQLEKM